MDKIFCYGSKIDVRWLNHYGGDPLLVDLLKQGKLIGDE